MTRERSRARTSGGSRWVTVASYGAVHEAELAVGILLAAGIPARLKSDHVGIFGPGFQGPTIRGVDVQVPSCSVTVAQAALQME